MSSFVLLPLNVGLISLVDISYCVYAFTLDVCLNYITFIVTTHDATTGSLGYIYESVP